MSQREVAALALPYMEKDNASHLDMEHWASDEIRPDQDPFACGTTLCAAGWTAHVLGYTVRPSGYVEHGRALHVQDLAQAQLELTKRQSDWLFMVASEEQAIRCFQDMADGLGFPNALMSGFYLDTH